MKTVRRPDEELWWLGANGGHLLDLQALGREVVAAIRENCATL